MYERMSEGVVVPCFHPRLAERRSISNKKNNIHSAWQITKGKFVEYEKNKNFPTHWWPLAHSSITRRGETICFSAPLVRMIVFYFPTVVLFPFLPCRVPGSALWIFWS